MRLLHLRVVLAAIDFDESSSGVVQAAHEIASAAGAKLHVVNVSSEEINSQATGFSGESERRSALARVLDRADYRANDPSLHILAGDPVHVIRSLADRIRADVIVLGRHRSRVAVRPGLGSTALGIATKSWAPCLVVSRGLRLPLERVLVPIDLSDTARGALVVALSWASALRGAHRIAETATGKTVAFSVLFVDTPTAAADTALPHRQALDDELNRLRRDAGTWASVDIVGETRFGTDVPAAIAAFVSEKAPDLVVLGTRGLGVDDDGRLGSVSLEVTRRVTAPTLLVPPAVWRMLAGES